MKIQNAFCLILLIFLCFSSVLSQKINLEEILKTCPTPTEKIFKDELVEIKLTKSTVGDVLGHISARTGVTFVADQDIHIRKSAIDLKNVRWLQILQYFLLQEGLEIQPACPVFYITKHRHQQPYGDDEINLNKLPFGVGIVDLKNVPSCPNSKVAPEREVKSICEGYRIGFFKLMNLLRMYVSRRGKIQIDKKSNIVIISDIKQNVEFLKGLAVGYDYADIYKISEEEYNRFRE